MRSTVDSDGNDVYIILAQGGHFTMAAVTRAEEIKSMSSYDPEKDHVYVMSTGDLGTLNSRIANTVDFKKYGKTVELSVYSHSGMADGPLGTEKTTGTYAKDGYQMRVEGWGEVKWNFDENKSIANFYGCKTSGFAQRFLMETDVLYSSGHGGNSNTSYEVGSWDKLYFPDLGDPVYMIAPDSEGNAEDMFIWMRYEKGWDYKNPDPERSNEFNTVPSSITKQGLKTNLYINDEGEVDGLKETPKPKEE